MAAEGAIKKFKSVARLKELLEKHYRGLDASARSREGRVAWCTSVGPAELLRSFGFDVYFPENHGAMLGTTRTAGRYIPFAASEGFSTEICSYLTSDVGAFLAGETPISAAYPGIEGVPRPNVLAYNTNQCREVQDWFEFYGRRFDVPVVGIPSPRLPDAITEELVRGCARQFEGLVPALEAAAGRPYSEGRLRETVRLSRDAAVLWNEILLLGRARPAPFTFFDMVILMAPIVVLRGLPEAVEFYRELKAEIERRIEKDVAAVDGERFRIYWEGMPVWGRLKDNALTFLGHEACVVASTYCNSWILDSLDPADPFGSMARTYLQIFIGRSETYKERYLLERIAEFGVDAVIFHEAKTCPYNSNARHGMPHRLKEEHGVASLVIEGDLNDLTYYSDVQVKNRIEAFFEMLRG